MDLENISYSKAIITQVLRSRLRDHRKIYCLNLDNRDIDIIINKFIRKFGTNFLYYSQIDSHLRQLLKLYALRSIWSIRNIIRSYLREIKEMTNELESNLTLEQYKNYYIEKYEGIVKKHFIYPSLFEDRHDTEELEYYKKFLFSIRKVSLRDFCDNLFGVKEDLVENNLYYYLFKRVFHLDTQMGYRGECYKKAHSLLHMLEKKQRNQFRKKDILSVLIESNIKDMDPLYLEKKFIELDLDSQFINEFRDFIPSAFWMVPGYSHFELMAKAIKDNIDNPTFLVAFLKFSSCYKELNKLILKYKKVEPEKPRKNFYHEKKIMEVEEPLPAEEGLHPIKKQEKKEISEKSIIDSINPKDLILKLPSRSDLRQNKLKFKKYQSKHLGNLDISTDDFSYTKEIGNWGEKYIYDLLCDKYSDNHDVEIIWNNELVESGKPFDILLKINKDQYFIEVKASITSEKRFIISGNEFIFAKAKKDSHWLYFVINAGTENPMYTKIENIYQKYHSNFFKLSSITLSF